MEGTDGGLIVSAPRASLLGREVTERAFRVKVLAGDIVFVCLAKTLHSHSAFLHPGVQIGTGEFTAGGNSMDWYPIQGC